MDGIGMDEFERMDDAERMALLSGESVAPQTEEAPVANPEAAPEVPQAEIPATAQPSAEEAQAQERKGDPEVPLRALREQNRQMQAILSDPQALAQYVAQHGYQLTQAQAQQQEAPELAYEDPAVIQAIVAQEVAPLKQYIGHLEAKQRQAAERDWTEQNYGAEAIGNAQAFDNDPNVSQLPVTALKHLAMVGMKFSDPQYLQSLVKAEAEKLAVPQVEAALKGNKPQSSTTISGIPPAEQNDTAVDPIDYSQDDWDKLPESKRNAILQGKRVTY